MQGSVPSAAIPYPLAKSSSSARRRSLSSAWWLLAPSLSFLALFTYWPVAQVAWRSVVEQSFGVPDQYGFGNYVRLFNDHAFAQAIGNTAVYAAGTVLPSIGLALLFALALQAATGLNAVLRTLLALPMMVPLVAAAALFTFLFLPGDGLLDHYLMRLGWGATNWLGNPDLALGSLCALTVWKNTGYYMLFFLAGLAGIPQDLHEAAKVEGATAVQRAWHVTAPLLGPTFAFVLVIAAVNVLVQVDHVIVVTGGGPSGHTNLLLSYIYQRAHQDNDAGLASAATVVSVAALFALSLLSLRTLERGMHYES